MSPAQFETALRGYCRRRPFQAFLVEFSSGSQTLVPHPEAIGPRGGLFILRRPDGGYVTFAAEGVSRLLDGPPVAKP